MRTLAEMVLAVLLVGGAVGAQHATFAAPSGFLPETVTIKATMPDEGQVCAEPRAGGLVSCRSVAEFRRWVRERPAK